MARTPEQLAWDDLRNPLGALTKCVDRIETIATGSGVPDVAYSWINGHGWIELKADMTCVNPEWDYINLRHYTALQRGWMRRRSGHGKNLWLMVRTSHGWYAVPGSLAWSLPEKASHQNMMDCNARYWPSKSASHTWLRQFL